MTPDETPINGKPARARRLRGVAEDVSLAVEENLVWRGGDALRSTFEVVRWPFERLLWAIQGALLWPLQDRAATLGRRDRALAGGALALVAVAAVAAGAALAGSAGSGAPASP